MKVYIDFETSSLADLKKVGVYRYAEHPSTIILSVGVACDNEKVTVLKRSELRQLNEYMQEGCSIVAHNAGFDRVIYNAFAKSHGWPTINITQWSCTMARAYAYGLPGSLENCAEVLGGPKKDKANQWSMRKLSKKPDQVDYRSKEYEELLAYNKQDVEVLRFIDQSIPGLIPFEKQVWAIDQEINDRGIGVDRTLIENARALNKRLVEEALEEFQEIVPPEFCDSPRRTAKFLQWLEANGCELPDIAAATVEDVLTQQDLDPEIRRALEIRQIIAGTAVKKYDVIARMAGPRLQGQFQYYGAHTGRWAGRGVQPHNLPRGGDRSPMLASVLAAGDTEMFISLADQPARDALKDIIRCAFVADPGKELFCADYTGIENKVLAWLAGEQHILDAYANGDDVYALTASATYNRPVDPEIDKEERTVGKVQSLSLGYQGGVGALSKLATSLSVDIEMLAHNGLAIGTQAEVESATWLYTNFGKEMERKTYIGLDILKQKWRKQHPNIVQFWQDVEEAARLAITHQKVFELRNLKLGYQNGALVIVLPSGRRLHYQEADVVAKNGRYSIRYKTEVRGGWYWEDTYGGKLVENITQAVARDFLAEALVNLHSAEYPIVLHVHDEAAVEVKLGSDFEAFLEILETSPDWAEGFQLTVSGFHGYRYRK